VTASSFKQRWVGGGIALWAMSVVIVLAAHGGGVAVLMNWPSPAPAGVPEAIAMLDLSSLAASPSTEKSVVAPDVVDQELSEKPPEPEEKPVEKVEPDPEPKKIEPPQKAEVELPAPLPPKPVIKPEKKKMAAVNTRTVAADRVAPQVTTPSAGANGRAKAEYSQVVAAHLNRYKKNIVAGGQRSGVVTLTFTLDRNGRILGQHISRGSGLSELDREAEEMVRRAQPFPTPPSELAGSQFPFTVPVRYTGS
jgi:protein TonB